jgi:hypothetical protein
MKPRGRRLGPPGTRIPGSYGLPSEGGRPRLASNGREGASQSGGRDCPKSHWLWLGTEGQGEWESFPGQAVSRRNANPWERQGIARRGMCGMAPKVPSITFLLPVNLYDRS